MSEKNEALEMLKGFLLLSGFHSLAALLIFVLGMMFSGAGSYLFLQIWFVGAIGFFFWQLLWVIPICIQLRKRGHIGMMKGVIINAAITALLNGSCFLLFFTPR